jgi:hypothetical protein
MVKTATGQDLHTRAILVSLRISGWNGQKFDKAVTKHATTAHGADETAGRFNKRLLPKSTTDEGTNAHEELKQYIAAIRNQFHYKQTLPWSDDGWALLPIKNYQEYTDGIRERQHEFNRLLDAFVRSYPRLREAARLTLGDMFNESDYPENIRAKYSFDLEFNPVPSGGDFRVALGNAEIEAIAASTEARVKASMEEATQAAANRLHEVLAKMTAALSDPNQTFRDTLVGNVRDLCEVLTRLNVAEDANLERLRRQAELLAMSEPETLRKNPDVRIETAARAQSILDDMTATFGKGIFG